MNAQQARRILDRLVGYKASPILWQSIKTGLSAGRVQSVAVRLVAEREREIRAFIPDEYWSVSACFTDKLDAAPGLARDWGALLATRDEKGNPPTQKLQNAWLGEHGGFRAELVAVGGESFEIRAAGAAGEAARPVNDDVELSRRPHAFPLVGFANVATRWGAR